MQSLNLIAMKNEEKFTNILKGSTFACFLERIYIVPFTLLVNLLERNCVTYKLGLASS